MHMDKKNDKSKRVFIPQKIGDAVKKINRKFTTKFGQIEFIIHSNWEKIVGEYFAEFSEPKHISGVPHYQNDIGETIYKNYLNVSVSPAAALELQHLKDVIIEKINSYYGYKAIIDLRIVQNYIPKNNLLKKTYNNNKMVNKNDLNSLKNKVETMENNDLKKSLVELGVNITKGT